MGNENILNCKNMNLENIKNYIRENYKTEEITCLVPKEDESTVMCFGKGLILVLCN